VELVPWKGDEDKPLPPLNTAIGTCGITCLVGDDSQALAAYLRALGGVDSPRSGELHLFDVPFVGCSQQHWQQLRLKLGFVTRTAPILSVLNGLENTVLPALYHKRMSRPEAESAARTLLQELRCEADLSLLPAYLTPLERTQLAIARAAILAPPVLLLEEPFHDLDIDEHDCINPYLGQWAKTHALVVSTRNLNFVKRYADRILFAGEDRILYFDAWQAFDDCPEGSVRDYLQHYRNSYDI
jgi:polar amino acid transport system ATP-binding protein